jgi:two-component system response regulator HydG
MDSVCVHHSGLIGDSTPMALLADQIATAARSNLTVLIFGESGTGKELVAHAIHDGSQRSNKSLVSFNCGAITETLLESELFGYARGAFTGATRDQKGLFEAADGGTLFLDEIGEMSPSCQVKLLRVLQEHKVRAVGAQTETPVDVRVIAATNRNLSHEIAVGRFRQDLFYRLAVLTIATPTLRERSTDIPLLVQHFLQEITNGSATSTRGFDHEALSALQRHDWPGNVRQLRHVVERLIAQDSNGGPITAKAVRQALEEISRFTVACEIPLGFRQNDSLDDFLARTTLGLYNHFIAITGNHSEVARILGTHRNTLYLRVERARRRVELAQR